MGRVGLQVLGGSWEAQAEVVVALRSQSREVHPQTCPRYFPWPTLAVSWGLSQSKARQASLLQASHAESVFGGTVSSPAQASPGLGGGKQGCTNLLPGKDVPSDWCSSCPARGKKGL